MIMPGVPPPFQPTRSMLQRGRSAGLRSQSGSRIISARQRAAERLGVVRSRSGDAIKQHG